jgi:hypothetical protein
LAGPIVRRAETTNVSIWFTLRENRDVTLNIFDSNNDLVVAPIITGNQSTGVSIGDHVFLYCVTASVLPQSSILLSTGTNYFYDIDFGNGDSLSGLITAGLLDLTYDGSKRPSFSLPPDDINKVRLIHGSCRKPHGEGYDAMEGVHEMILSSVKNGSIDAIDRPHQLFLTGDQIYADDVADALLYMIDDAAKVLFKWDEDYSPFTPADLAPGKRNSGNKLSKELGFTGMIPDQFEFSKSHLLKFREYATMYLFVWSEVLWPLEVNFPTFNDVYDGVPESFTHDGPILNGVGGTTSYNFPYFKSEFGHIKRFFKTIKKIRKALANIPTYMAIDDHEITDDWNINWKWCKDVYSKTLGRRTIQNGLLAYALFQAWGNSPKQFTEGLKSKLLEAANNWRGEEIGFETTVIKSLLNIQKIDPKAKISDFPHSSNPHFDWHFSYESKSYAVYVQDSRTWRRYPKDSDLAFTDLISKKGYERQLPKTFPSKEIILIVAPCPVVGVPLIEREQKKQSSFKDKVEIDTEHWGLNKLGFERLSSNLASRMPIVGSGSSKQRIGRLAFLSGDVHYGLSARYQIWGTNFIEDKHPGIETNVIFAQLTASPFNNQLDGHHKWRALFKKGTVTLHMGGYPISITKAARNTHELPKPIKKFAWLNDSKVLAYTFRVGVEMVDRILPKGLSLLPHDSFLLFQAENFRVIPHWRYRIDWILGTSTGTHPTHPTNPERIPIPIQITVPPNPSNRVESLQKYLAITDNHGSYTGAWGSGKEIVGENNLGEIRFDFKVNDKKINHIIWWRLRKLKRISGSNPLQPFPLTTYTISMNREGDKNHKNQLIEKPTNNGV